MNFEQILRSHYLDGEKKEILRLLPGWSWSKIKYQANKLGLSRKKIFTNKGKILLEPNITNFYWWGFITADGCIRKNNSLCITLSSVDHKHLEKFANYIGKNIYNRNGFSTVEFVDNINIPKLKAFVGYKVNKTYNPIESIDFINTDDQLLSFFIGLIDGDGSISYRKKNFRSIKIELHENWGNFLLDLSKMLARIGYKPSIKKTNKKTCYLYLGTKKSYNSLLNFINRNNIPHLERKWKPK